MNFIVWALVNALAVYFTGYLLPGVYVKDLLTAVVVGLVLTGFNAFLRPILVFFTLPITILTLGFFIFIINAFLIMLASRLIVGFSVSNFFWALLFSLVLSLVNSALSSTVP